MMLLMFPPSGHSPQPTSDPREEDVGTKGYGLVLQPVGVSRLKTVRLSKYLHTSLYRQSPFPHSSPGMTHSVSPSHLCSEIPHPTLSLCLPPYGVRNALGVGNPHCILIIPGPKHIPGCQPVLGKRNPPSFLQPWAAQTPDKLQDRTHLLSTSAEASDLAKTMEFEGVKSPRSVPKPNFKSKFLWK